MKFRVWMLKCVIGVFAASAAGGFVYAAVATTAPATVAQAPALAPESVEFFENKIRPVLVEKCYKCHSETSQKLKGDLKLDTAAATLRGGESGSPSVVPGHPEKSKLIEAIAYKTEDLQMPPKERLPANVVADFEAWVKMGAPDPRTGSKVPSSHLDIAAAKREFWSFQSPQPHAAPTVKHAAWVKTPVDAFIAAKLEEKNLEPSPPADKRTLIRRATFDLLGLPPTLEEIAAFEADTSPNAFEKVIDRLLASPHYGERWGRYWLDVCRYADSKGYVFEEERRYPFAYTFRDWVVRSFNEDLPYDQFIIEQLAADKLPLKEDKRPLAAMGFLTVGRRFLNSQPDIIDDRLDLVGRGLMGLSISCARCHDHKFDPIPTKDYYSLYGVFSSSQEPGELPEISGGAAAAKTPETADFEKQLTAAKAEIDQFRQKRLTEITAELRSEKSITDYLMAAHDAEKKPDDQLKEVVQKRNLRRAMLGRWKTYLAQKPAEKSAVFDAWRQLAALPEPEIATKVGTIAKGSANPLIAAALTEKPPKTLAEVAARYGALLSKYAKSEKLPDPNQEALRQALYAEGAPTALTIAEIDSVLQKDDKNKLTALRRKADALMVTHPGSPAKAMVMVDLPRPVQPVVFKRGNPGMPGEPVPRQFLAVLSPEKREPFKEGSGRLELAKSIASKDNPLTARVMLNRIWAHHFGQGLVRTPSDFGRRGELPTHPELLDNLAVRFMNEGWSVKKVHKLLMLSAVYQQGSNDNPAARAADPENRLLWKMNRQRLDFEGMRDSLLATSGQIDLTVGGRPIDIAQPGAKRRTIYGYIDRQNLPSMFRSFDFASPDSHSPQRYFTTVPQQALYMMNSPFVIDTAKTLVKRAEVGSSSQPEKKIERLYQIAFGRSPTKQELEMGLQFMGEDSKSTATTRPMGAWEQYAQVLLETNEFVFVD